MARFCGFMIFINLHQSWLHTRATSSWLLLWLHNLILKLSPNYYFQSEIMLFFYEAYPYIHSFFFFFWFLWVAVIIKQLYLKVFLGEWRLIKINMHLTFFKFLQPYLWIHCWISRSKLLLAFITFIRKTASTSWSLPSKCRTVPPQMVSISSKKAY